MDTNTTEQFPGTGARPSADGSSAVLVRSERAHDTGVGPVRVLYVEDDAVCRELLAEFLRHVPAMEVVTAPDAASALALLARTRPGVAVVDAWLGGSPADALVAALAAHDPTLPVVMLSADANEATVARFRRLGTAAYLPKPFDLAHLVGVLRSLARREASNPSAPRERHTEGSSSSAHTTATSWN